MGNQFDTITSDTTGIRETNEDGMERWHPRASGQKEGLGIEFLMLNGKKGKRGKKGEETPSVIRSEWEYKCGWLVYKTCILQTLGREGYLKRRTIIIKIYTLNRKKLLRKFYYVQTNKITSFDWKKKLLTWETGIPLHILRTPHITDFITYYKLILFSVSQLNL